MMCSKAQRSWRSRCPPLSDPELGPLPQHPSLSRPTPGTAEHVLRLVPHEPPVADPTADAPGKALVVDPISAYSSSSRRGSSSAHAQRARDGFVHQVLRIGSPAGSTKPGGIASAEQQLRR